MMKARSRSGGFTLIEMAAVVVISGLLMAGGIQLYNQYLNDKYAHESYDKLQNIVSSLAIFSNASHRLPCPSDPRIPVTDAQSGREIGTCAALMASPVGTCMDGVCKVDGFRDTDADTDSNVDPVLIGGLPFADIRSGGQSETSLMTTESAIDPWGYQFTYAVSGNLTGSAYRASYGAIRVQTEPPRIDLVNPPDSSQYVVVAHGPDHRGAYSSQGVISVPCGTLPVTQDADNCDGDGAFTAGLRRDTAGANHFDDIIAYNSYSIDTLWDFVGTSADIYNKNPGFVGVGIDSPTQELDVAADVQALNARQTRLCDKASGTDCWSPDLLSAPASTGLSLYCPNTNTPGMIDVLMGIGLDASVPPKPKAICGKVARINPLPSQVCPGSLFVNGFNADGTVICVDPLAVP